MKPSLRVLALSALLSSVVLSHGAEYFADQVLGYTPGAGVGGFTNPAAALGKPGGNIGAGTFNPFSPNFATSNATGVNDAPPASPVLADFGKPFTGALADFNGQSFSGVLGVLGGSAGGTWLDLDATGLSEVGYIRFNGVASGQTLEINGVSINGQQAGSAVPEPNAACLLLVGAALGLRRRG